MAFTQTLRIKLVRLALIIVKFAKENALVLIVLLTFIFRQVLLLASRIVGKTSYQCLEIDVKVVVGIIKGLSSAEIRATGTFLTPKQAH